MFSPNYIIVAIIIYLIYTILNLLWKRICRQPTSLEKYGSSNRYVVITGGTDGLGKAIVLELAKRGWRKFIILGRNPKKAKNLESDLKEMNSQAEVQLKLVDLKEANNEDLQNLISEIFLFDVGLLVNNLSIIPGGLPEPFIRNSVNDILATIQINITLPTLLTHAFFKENLGKSQKSAILNIGSFGGTCPIPLLPVYSASKAYQNYLSLASSVEGKYENIDITVANPGMIVPTAMSSSYSQKASFWEGSSSPESTAEGCLDSLGLEAIWAPTWVHWLQAKFCLFLPPYIRNKILFRVNMGTYHNSTKKK